MNRLAKESSPYLLQHAQNPVDWYPWGHEALQAARVQDRPILVSIGYAACHWCHVMERESFEDPAVATLMNERFINIKVDREERPDIDHIYMDAVTAMTGSGGWPLNVFLTPEGKPFYGGTYFPPSPYHQRPSWKNVLDGVAEAWSDRREEIVTQASNLTDHLLQSNRVGEHSTDAGPGTQDQLHQIAIMLMKNADTSYGGFGRAPKFPQTFVISWLLRYAARFVDHRQTQESALTWNTDASEWSAPESLKQALLSLDAMLNGGIYDQLGGGLARYSTDNQWLVPHFEKMLYDQALLVQVLAEAFQLTHNARYGQVIHQTIDFLQRELMSAEGGFYAALDADSEGEEGKFYVWEKGEIEEVLGEDAPLACDWLGITDEGNWEGINIMTNSRSLLELQELGYCNGDAAAIEKKQEQIRAKLLQRRSERVRPGLDDKQLLGWNALMNTALSKAYAATGVERYFQLAERNMNWMLTRFTQADGSLKHSYKNGDARFPGFLDDYAYLVQALIHLQEISGNNQYIDRAVELINTVERQFTAENSSLFYYTNDEQEDIIVRKREVYDGAQPSGNAVMAFNLWYLGILTDNAAWKTRSAAMMSAMVDMIIRYPASFGVWATHWMGYTDGYKEIAVVGMEHELLRRELLANFIPFKVFQSASHENSAYPLLRDKSSDPNTLIYLCQAYSCQRPVATARELLDHF